MLDTNLDRFAESLDSLLAEHPIRFIVGSVVIGLGLAAIL